MVSELSSRGRRIRVQSQPGLYKGACFQNQPNKSTHKAGIIPLLAGHDRSENEWVYHPLACHSPSSILAQCSERGKVLAVGKQVLFTRQLKSGCLSRHSACQRVSTVALLGLGCQAFGSRAKLFGSECCTLCLRALWSWGSYLYIFLVYKMRFEDSSVLSVNRRNNSL